MVFKKEIKPEKTKEKELIIDKENTQSILAEALSGLIPNPNQDNSTKDLETAKVVIGMIMNPIHLNSTSNLSLDEIDDLSDAYYLNTVFNNPLIAKKIITYIELKRSQTDNPKNLLTILSDIVGKGMDALPESTGISKFFGNRFNR